MRVSNPLIILVVIISISSCGDKEPNLHSTVWIINNSSKIMIAIGTFTNSTDTLIPEYNPYLVDDYYKIHSNTKYSLDLRDTYEGRFKDPNVKFLRIFLFEEPIFKTNSWDSIRINYLIAKRYDLTLVDLNNKNWTIEYP
jgi:hypothetical protein